MKIAVGAKINGHMLKIKCRGQGFDGQWLNLTLSGRDFENELNRLNLNQPMLIVDIKLNTYEDVIELTGLPSTKIIQLSN